MYAQRGFDVDRIAETCTDTEEHPKLGLCYKVDIKSVITTDIERKVSDELLKTISKHYGTSAHSKQDLP